MPRAVVGVRVARPTDAEDLVEVWSEVGTDTHRVMQPGGADRLLAYEEARCAITRIEDDPDELLLVAEGEAGVVGVVHLRRAPISPIHVTQAVHVSHLYVVPGSRRRGVASALLATATSWAEDTNAAHLLATTPASSRDAHRFLARLGFCQIAVLRGVSVGSLRARLAGVIGDGVRGKDRLIAARRSLRRRAGRSAATP